MNNKNEFPAIIDKCKLIVVGNAWTGKTSILKQFIYKKFTSQENPTYAGESYKKLISVNSNQYIEVDFWDTAGQEKLRSVNKIFYKGANIVLMVYDITNYTSYYDIKEYWINEIKQFCSEEASKFCLIEINFYSIWFSWK